MNEVRSLVYFALICRDVTALVFARSVSHKVIRPIRFARGVAAYGVAPERAAPLAAALVIAAELVIVVSHGIGRGLDLAAPMCLGLLVTFGGITLLQLANGRKVPCLCFSGDEDEVISARSLLRLVLIGMCEFIVVATKEAAAGAELALNEQLTVWAWALIVIVLAAAVLDAKLYARLLTQDAMVTSRRRARRGAAQRREDHEYILTRSLQ